MTSSAAISSMHVMMRGPMRFTAGAKRSSGLFLFASYNGEFLFRCAVGSLVNTDRLAGVAKRCRDIQQAAYASFPL